MCLIWPGCHMDSNRAVDRAWTQHIHSGCRLDNRSPHAKPRFLTNARRLAPSNQTPQLHLASPDGERVPRQAGNND